jgi:ATP-binding cassette, subfamily B, bacterial
VTTIDLTEVRRPTRRRRLSRLPDLVRRAFALLWAAAPREFAVAAILQAVAGLSVAGQLLAGGRVLEVLTAGGTAGAVVVPLVVLAVTSTVVAFSDAGRAEQQRLLAELVGLYATDRLLVAATAAPLIAFDRATFHDRLERARLNSIIRPLDVANGTVGLISACCTIAGAASALILLEPMLIVLVIAALIPTWIAGARASRLLHRFSAAQTEGDRRRAYLLATATSRSEAHEVRAFGLEPFLRRRHEELYRARIAAARRLIRRRLRLAVVGASSTSMLTAATVGGLTWLVVAGRVSIADAGVAAAAVVVLAQRLRSLARSAAALYEGSLFLEDFTSFIDEAAQSAGDGERSAEHEGPAVGPVPAPQRFTTLSARDLWFAYPGSDRPVLRGVSIDVHAGEVVALVGLNGSGKTTLAKVLAGLYRPDHGTVHWDDVDLATCDAAALRDAVTVVFQDFARYQLSLRDNIVMGRHRRSADDAAVVDAARRAGVLPMVDGLSAGLDAQLGPHFFGGHDLSLGQWQRVALARALFRDAPFLVLDEPTASLDPDAEAALFADVRALCRARSVLLISHRFASVRTADRIYVLRDGRVIETGSHSQLMAHDGHYAHLFTTQAARYGADVATTGAGGG